MKKTPFYPSLELCPVLAAEKSKLALHAAGGPGCLMLSKTLATIELSTTKKQFCVERP